jgi:hypothetical protein
MDADRRETSSYGVLGSSRFLLGAGAIVLGVLFLADNLDWFDTDPLLDWWPLLPLGFGLAKLWAGRIGLGTVWTVIGALLLIDNVITPIDLEDFLLPLLFIGFGTLMITRALERQRGRELGLGRPTADGAGWRQRLRHGAWRDRGRYATDAADLHAFALMGGATRRCHSPAFRGGEAIAVMGGTEIDLRSARLAPEGAALDVLAFWGVVQILVPEGWEVDNQVLPVMGGVEDRTRPLAAATFAPRGNRSSATVGAPASRGFDQRGPTAPPPPPGAEERAATAAPGAQGLAADRSDDDDGYLAEFAPPAPADRTPSAPTAASAPDEEPDEAGPTGAATYEPDREGAGIFDARPRLVVRGVALMGGVEIGHEPEDED